MKKNVGNYDRMIRIVLGVLFIAGGLFFKSWWGILGIVLLLTGLVRTCPLYVPLKITTNKSK